MMQRLMWLSGVLAIFAIAAVAQTSTMTMMMPPPPRTISVTGTAQRMVPPDVSTIVVAVQTQADTVARAVQQNNTASNRVMDAIKKLNIAGLTMRTLGFDVNPIYEQRPPNAPASTTPPRIVGYQVVNRLEVRLHETGDDGTRLSANVGRVLDAALAAGANRVDNVSFSLDEQNPVMLEVLADATKNAQKTAMTMAAAAGVDLGPLMTLSSTPYFQPPQPVFAARAEAAQAGVPIAAGTLTVSATVSAVYGIR
ncbi:MAG: SIMPL domain-containing protein [Armatimonadota bacterium]